MAPQWVRIEISVNSAFTSSARQGTPGQGRNCRRHHRGRGVGGELLHSAFQRSTVCGQFKHFHLQRLAFVVENEASCKPCHGRELKFVLLVLCHLDVLRAPCTMLREYVCVVPNHCLALCTLDCISLLATRSPKDARKVPKTKSARRNDGRSPGQEIVLVNSRQRHPSP